MFTFNATPSFIMYRNTLKMIRYISAILVILVGSVACDRASPPPEAPAEAAGTITDWPKAVQEAISESPNYSVETFAAEQERSFNDFAEQISVLDRRAETAAETGLTLVESARDVAATMLPERDLVVAYSLQGSIYCDLAVSLVKLTEIATEFGEIKAKQHAFSHGNQYSWPGFVQAVWADISADRAEWAVEQGSGVAAADEAIHELGSVIWHSVEAINFEQQSFAVTGDPAAQSSASFLDSASKIAGGAQYWLNQCKPSL